MEFQKQNQAMEEENQPMEEEEREAEMARLWERTWQEEKRKLEKYMKIAGGEQTIEVQPHILSNKSTETNEQKETKKEKEKIFVEKEQWLLKDEENKRKAMIARRWETLWQEEQPNIQNAEDDQMDEETCVPIEATQKPKGILKRFQRRIGRLFRQFCCCLRDDSM
jgi:hypothetical protein